MVKVHWKWPRLINIAVGLTVAAGAAYLAASQIRMPHDERGMVLFPPWKWTVWEGWPVFVLAALAAWALAAIAAVIRWIVWWNADFAGY